MVWADIGHNLKANATSIGIETLNNWINATCIFNYCMSAENIECGFEMLWRALDCIKAMRNQTYNLDMKRVFTDVSQGFEKVLDSGDMSDINTYMKDVYPEFKDNLNC